MKALAWLLLLLVPLAGCLEDNAVQSLDSDGDGLSDQQEEAAGTDPQDPDSDGNGVPDGYEEGARGRGSPQEREAERDDGEVTVSIEPAMLGWVARRTVTIGNGLVGVDWVQATVEQPFGGTLVTGQDKDRYDVTVSLWGRGATEDEAVRALETLHVDHQDLLYEDGSVGLATEVRADEYEPVQPVPFVQVGNSDRGVDLEYRVPNGDALSLAVSTGSGGIDARDLRVGFLSLGTGSGGIDGSGLRAGTLQAHSGSGGVALKDIDAGILYADTGSGGIDVEARYVQGVLHTGSGGIDAVLTPTGTGALAVSTGSGGADLRLTTGAAYGYDVVASAGSGGIEVDLPETESVGPQSDHQAHVRTVDFDARTIRSTLAVSSGSGGVSITG